MSSNFFDNYWAIPSATNSSAFVHDSSNPNLFADQNKPQTKDSSPDVVHVEIKLWNYAAKVIDIERQDRRRRKTRETIQRAIEELTQRRMTSALRAKQLQLALITNHDLGMRPNRGVSSIRKRKELGLALARK